MRRGPGGGLIVSAPDPNAAVQPVTLYLDYADVNPKDLFDVRSALELTCARIAAEKIDEDGISRLREILERERELGTAGIAVGHPHELHIAIAELTGNPAMALLVKILTRLTFERTKDLTFDPAEFADVHRAHVAIAEAIIAGDGALAQHRIGRHLAASTAYYYQRQDHKDD
jgi:DNA-binding FadR family transcriptional regulator